MKCLRFPDKDCPQNGCADMSDCAISEGWSQGVPPDRDRSGNPVLPAWLEWLAVKLIKGVTRGFITMTWIVRHLAEIGPVAWFVIVAVISFTVVMLVL